MREFWKFRGKIMGISQKCSKITILGISERFSGFLRIFWGFSGIFRGF